MRNIWRLFVDDLKRLGGNVITAITVIGLIVLPSLFSWYNILACWDVFENTGNLTVAVANSDEGYESDLVPFKVKLGEEVVSALRENDQLDWVFTDEEDAIDGARAGRYYAAVVIPSSFSKDMMSFYSDDVEHAQITYYSNQKKSAIAPKVTDQGADRVSQQVNETFAETLSEITLDVAQSLADYLDSSEVQGQLAVMVDHLSTLGRQMGDASEALSAYSELLGTVQVLLEGTSSLLDDSQSQAGDVSGGVEGAKEAARTAVDAVEKASAALQAAIDATAKKYDAIPPAVEAAFAEADQSAKIAEGMLRDQAAASRSLGDEELALALEQAADQLRDANAQNQKSLSTARASSAEAQQKVADAKTHYEKDLKPKLDELSDTVGDAEESITAAAETLESASSDISADSRALASKIGSSRKGIEEAVAKLTDSAAGLEKLGDDISEAVVSGDSDALKSLLGQNPEMLASFVAAPVQLNRVAVYPVENFGSAMSPLYTTLALWIGALLIMVTLKPHPSKRALAKLDNPTPRQTFLGRFGVMSLLSVAQSTFLSVGNLAFLGVQAENPLLYLLCFWVAGLAFAFIIYTLVSLFANLGKALGVVLLIVQVGGGGGSFPLPLLPEFFQNISPYLPITHAVNAMRAAMFGIYQGDFWVELAVLALFTVPMIVLGLVLNGPLSKVVPKFIERVERSKVM